MVVTTSTQRTPATPKPREPSASIVGQVHDAARDFLKALYNLILEYRPIGLFTLNFMLVLKGLSEFTCFILNHGKRPGKPKTFNPEIYYYEAPKEGDSRSPCPALNSLANHGYLPRNGRAISRAKMIEALQQGFKLTYLHAWFITTNGYLLTGQFNHMSLFDLCRHGGIEHNASLVHADAPPEQEYAPSKIDWALFRQMVGVAKDPSALTLPDIARARVLRESQSFVDPLHAEIARGEIGLVLDIFGGRARKLDVEMLQTWWKEERFPDNWRPRAVQSLPHTMLTSQTMKAHMTALRSDEGDSAPIKKTMFIHILEAYMYLIERW